MVKKYLPAAASEDRRILGHQSYQNCLAGQAVVHYKVRPAEQCLGAAETELAADLGAVLLGSVEFLDDESAVNLDCFHICRWELLRPDSEPAGAPAVVLGCLPAACLHSARRLRRLM